MVTMVYHSSEGVRLVERSDAGRSASVKKARRAEDLSQKSAKTASLTCLRNEHRNHGLARGKFGTLANIIA